MTERILHPLHLPPPTEPSLVPLNNWGIWFGIIACGEKGREKKKLGEVKVCEISEIAQLHFVFPCFCLLRHFQFFHFSIMVALFFRIRSSKCALASALAQWATKIHQTHAIHECANVPVIRTSALSTSHDRSHISSKIERN
jgi:hypothetical protein